MGQAFAQSYPEAKSVFDEADEALGFSISKLCFEGTEDELKRTEITQPAILTTSIASLAVLQKERPDLKPDFALGHSLGEWSALVAVGALRFADAVQLVHQRGKLMQTAVPEGEGAMAAVLGLEPEQVTQICAAVTSGVVAAANFNANGQIVISGAKAAVEAASEAADEAGATRVLPLPVSAPFHCSLMKPAAEGLAKALEPIEIGQMSAPVISNVEATANQDPARVKALLVEQVTAPVRWVESVQALAKTGTTQGLEIGPGKVLNGLVRRIDRSVKVLGVRDEASLKKTLESLA